MSRTDLSARRPSRSVFLLYILPVVAAGMPVIADAATRHPVTSSASAAKKHPARKAVHPVSAAPAAPASQATISSATRAATVRQARVASQDSEDIVVTGSALRSNRYSPNPVQTVKAQDIQQTSAVTLGDYLMRLPSMGSSGTSSGQQNGGDGLSCSDIRNLGSSRTLVLVDGKRMVQTQDSGVSCADLSTIPTDMIESVEILKDGGSELYGADAVAGVINIKMKHNVQGGNILVRGGLTDVGDDRTGKISGHYGFNFDHDRGNISVFGQYTTQGGVQQKDRGYLSNPWGGDVEIGQAPTFGSGYSAASHIMSDASGTNLAANPGGGFHQFTSADRYNYARGSSLAGYNQQASLGGDAHYDINKHLNLYANVRYTHKATEQTLAPMPVGGSIFPSNLPNPLSLPENAPYYSSEMGTDPYMYRRYTELGARETNQATDTWQVTAGSKGVIVGKWMYDVSMSYGTSQATYNTLNLVNYRHLMEIYGIRQTDPTSSSSPVTYDPSVCVASAGCELGNPLQDLTGRAKQYAVFNEHDHSDYQLRDFNARVHNDDIVRMPYAHGGHFGIAAGVEHRSEQGSYHADPVSMSGDSAGNSSANTGGGFNSTEVYIEGKLQLLHDAFLAKDLMIDGQGRWVHYNTFGSTQIWKVAIDWAPVRDISFSATLGTSFRQPSVAELYGGQALGYASANDPCSQVSSYGAQAAAVQMYCSRQGINTATFTQPNPQVPVIAGGNSKLQPETSKTYTIGTVITPRWTPGLRIGVNYWHYYVKNTINTLPTQYILDQCATGASATQCDSINPRNSAGQLSTVENIYQNVGGIRTSGIDFDLTYRLRLGLRDTLTLNNNFQQLISYLQQNEPGGAWLNYTGRMLYQGYGAGRPRVRDYATLTWAHDNFRLTYMMNYTGGMKWNDGTSDVSCKTYAYCSTPGIFSHDLTAGYRLGRWNFEGGVNNILDKKAPFVADGSTNTNANMYMEQIIGRYVFLQASVNL
ncbi:TonB-dependent receptor [Acetobacter sp. AN02]|uniref:TonB-dependent receptor plug domain-containing protein n=1 Tax=Acetobacter sp. AN02 TaxID=2894186 RepID=UPI0024344484|nr:TonB-dependent receptor [Acetobacter sp. AN02]MDG6094753.1 TonB-dependent receptor [Acetobacter sp. AN02]